MKRSEHYAIYRADKKNSDLEKAIKLAQTYLPCHSKKILKEEIRQLRKKHDIRKSLLLKSYDKLLDAKRIRRKTIEKSYISHANFHGNYYCCENGDMRFVSDYDPRRRMAVVRVDGLIQFSRNHRAYRKCSGLVLWDLKIEQYRFFKVGPDIETIDEALDYIKPAAIKKAEKAGKKITRQGKQTLASHKKWNFTELLNSANACIIYRNGDGREIGLSY